MHAGLPGLASRRCAWAAFGQTFSSRCQTARERLPEQPTRILVFKAERDAGCWLPTEVLVEPDGNRTDDLMLAKHALSQLSYGPEDLGSVVGPGRVELPTSRLSGVRSNHLSYGPQFPDVRRSDCPKAVGPVKSGPIKSSPISSVCVREERETKTAVSRQNGPLMGALNLRNPIAAPAQ